MITLLTGENTFEIERASRQLEAEFDGRAERIDGSNLETRQLPDLLMGATLFADKRLVIIKNLSENKIVWTDFGDWLPRVSDDIDLVLIDAKPDKRTVTFRELKKVANVKEFQLWTDRDVAKAEAWLLNEATAQGITLNKKSVQLLLRKVGLDQWSLFHALEKLSLVPEVTDAVIDDIIDTQPAENVFNLFDAALRGDSKKIVDMLRTLELSEDPYRLFALLSSQAFQLAVIIAAEPGDAISKDFGIHPYVLSKLSTTARKLGKNRVIYIVNIFVETDDDMKISKADPWLLIERALIKVATLH